MAMIITIEELRDLILTKCDIDILNYIKNCEECNCWIDNICELYPVKNPNKYDCIHICASCYDSRLYRKKIIDLQKKYLKDHNNVS